LNAPDEFPAELEALRTEALAWVIRLHSGDATSDDATALARWRGKSQAHEAAFRDAVGLWRTFGAATRRLVAEKQRVRSEPSAGPPRRLAGRRGLIGGVIAASLGGAYFAVAAPLGLWPSLKELSADYRTAKGEQRVVSLSNDVSLTLNTQTAIAVRSIRDNAHIELISGEASIAAKRDGASPFVVDAAAGRIAALRANFNVRCLDGVASVSCIDGAVEVELKGRAVRLTNDQQVSYSAATGIGVVSPVDPRQATAWQDGLLIVRDWRLTRLVDEINRYRTGKIIVMDTQLGNRLVTGTFHLDHLDDFIGQTAGLFGASVRSLPGGVVLLL
jgi:transmembrane sensor